MEKVITGLDEGLGVRALFDGRTSYGYTNDLARGLVEELARGVAAAAGRTPRTWRRPSCGSFGPRPRPGRRAWPPWT